MTPVDPGKKAMGPNTAASTSPMPMSALVIWSMDLAVASLGESPSSAMTRSTFSTTTMASSTSSPMASTMANMVSMLMEKPNSAKDREGPQQHHRHGDGGNQGGPDTFPIKRYMITKTSRIASKRVLTTSSMATLVKGVVS